MLSYQGNTKEEYYIQPYVPTVTAVAKTREASIEV
jgi:hypothetical protein